MVCVSSHIAIDPYREENDMKIKTLSLSAAAVCLMATGALAQNTTNPSTNPAVTPPAATAPATTGAVSTTKTTTSTTTEAIQFTSTATDSEMPFSKLKGTNVRNAAGEKLGDINDVLIDMSGKPSVIIVGVGGFLGLGEKDVGVPFQSMQFTRDNNTEVARLDVTKDALKAAPTFVYPNTAQANNSATKTQ